ncbi:MAG: DMT family transporter [Pseudomonadota bacterium]
MDKSKAKYENWRGMLWAFIAVLSASAMSISVRGASLEIDPRLIVFHRFVLGMAILLIVMVALPQQRKSLRFSDPKLHIIRGVLIGVSTLLGFYALATVELAAATVLFGLAPIFATIISILFLGQSIGVRRVAAIFTGFVGAIIIIDPRFEMHIGMLSAVGAAFLFGTALAMSRGLAQKDGTFSTLFSSTAMTVVVSAVASIHIFEWPTGLTIWIWLWVLIVTGLLRQFADIQSYKFAEASVLTPIFYLRLIFIAVGGYVLFNEIPRMNTWIGASIVIASTLYMTYRERQLEIEK